MICYLYQSTLNPNQILLIPDRGNFEKVPRKIILQLGNIEFKEMVNLKETEIKSFDSYDIIEKNINEDGYHWQHVFLK